MFAARAPLVERAGLGAGGWVWDGAERERSLVGSRRCGAGGTSRTAARYAWDGVYTDVQADRGEREYGRTCAHCHGLSLEGDGASEIPTLVSDTFMRKWRGRNVQALFDTLMRSMPADDRGSMTPRTTADMVAYLLRANGAPAGGRR